MAVVAVVNFGALPCKNTETRPVRIVRSNAFITLKRFPSRAQIIAVFGTIGVFHPFVVFQTLSVKTKLGILAVNKPVTGAIYAVSQTGKSARA